MSSSPTASPDFTPPDVIVDTIARGPEGPRLLLFDYDGTLCEFAPTPDAAFMPARRRELLRRLAARPGVTVGVVSGRRLEDVRRRVGLEPPVVYAGLHGLEIDGVRRRFVHERLDSAQLFMREFRRELKDDVGDLAGIVVENKHASVTLHFRMAAPEQRVLAERALARLTERPLREGQIRLQRGDNACEVLPNLPWHKGDAVRWLQELQAEVRGTTPWTLYVGDDHTDENAFRTIRDAGVTVVVGQRRSAARYRLGNPAEVEQLIECLVRAPVLAGPLPVG
jgi:trehalose 6-phosphate phosphatase